MKKNKKIRIAAISVIAVLLVIVAVMFIKIKYLDKVPSIICVYDDENKESSIYVNSKLIGKVEGEAALHNNMDNSSYFVTTDAAVYLMENTKITEIAKDMTLKVFANNSNEALLESKDGELFLYKDEDLIEVTDETASVVAISGDGKVYSYSTEEAAYFGTEPGKEKKIENVVISHISKDGEYMYASKHTSEDEFELLVINSDGESKVIEEKATSIIGLNASGTELMYTSPKGTFVVVDGNESKKVTEKLVYEIYYFDDENSWCGDFWSIETLKGVVCEVMETDGTTTPTTICKISDEYEAKAIVNDCYEFIGINKSMTKVFYKDKDDNLYRVDTKAGAKSELLAEEVLLARISPDGKNVYFTREDSETLTILYHIENGLKEKELAYVYDFFDIIVYDDYCYIEADEIHYVKNDKVEKIEDLDSLECFFIDYLTQKAYGYDKNNVYEIDGKKKKALEGDFGNIASYDYVY